MPPLPLSPIFQEASNLMLAMQRRAKDLETFQIPRLRDCKASLAVQQQYAGELREDVDGMYRQLEVGV